MKLKTEEIDGRKVVISVTEQGRFVAAVDGDEYVADKLDDVLAIVRKALRKAKVRLSIAASMVGTELKRSGYRRAVGVSSTTGVRHFTITGMHGSNGNVLIKWGDTGETEQYRGWGSGTPVRRLNDADVQRYKQLALAAKTANEELEKFLATRSLDSKMSLREYVEEQIRLKEDDPKETEEEDNEDPR